MSTGTSEKSIIKQFLELNVNGKTEEKKVSGKKLTYLSWAWAWSEALKIAPRATYEILKFENNLPYVFDEKTGYMVFTKVTIDNLTHEMWLPVMNGANKAMKEKVYSYKVKKYQSNELEDKFVEPATMFDINKSIMRCLVKNLAMFGLGLNIYAGEDLPLGDEYKQANPTATSEKSEKSEKTTTEPVCPKCGNSVNQDMFKSWGMCHKCKTGQTNKENK